MATSRKESDHRYNTSEKGKVRRRRYDALVRDMRRRRDLEYQLDQVDDTLLQVREELAQLERILIGDRQEEVRSSQEG